MITESTDYDQDFVAWALHSAELLRSGQYDALDLEHLAEQVEGLGNWPRRQGKIGVKRILMCFIKWQLQPHRRRRATYWQTTIMMRRQRLSSLLQDSPSLREPLAEQLQRCYSEALKQGPAEVFITSHSLPAECPYTLEQVLNPDYMPE